MGQHCRVMTQLARYRRFLLTAQAAALALHAQEVKVLFFCCLCPGHGATETWKSPMPLSIWRLGTSDWYFTCEIKHIPGLSPFWSRHSTPVTVRNNVESIPIPLAVCSGQWCFTSLITPFAQTSSHGGTCGGAPCSRVQPGRDHGHRELC